MTLLVDAYFFILKVLVFFAIGKMPLLNFIDQDDIFISLILDVQMDNHSTNLPVCRFQKTRAIC